jgi:hypothetical protein
VSTIDEFERQVVTALLAGSDPLLEALRAQYSQAAVTDRELTRRGFVTHFDVPDSAPGIDREFLHLDDLQVEVEGAAAPVDTVLSVENGYLQSLECSVYEGEFPETPRITAAWYYGTQRYPGINQELLAARHVDEVLEEEE